MASVPPPSARYVWYVVTLLGVINAVNYMDRMALSALAPSIKADLQLSDGELGLLIGFAFALFYSVCGIFIARWADRGVRRDIIVWALVVWSSMTALCGAAQNFWHLFLTRMGVGVGESGCFPVGQSMVCDYVPLKNRPAAFAINQFGVSGGTMLGMALAGALGETLGWRWTFVVLGLPGIALAGLVRLTVREPPRGRFEAAGEENTHVSIGKTMAVLWRCRTYRLLVMDLAASGFAVQGMILWLPSFYSRVHGLNLSSTGISLGLAIGVGGGLGLLLGGLLANYAASRDVRLPLRIGVWTMFLAAPTVLGAVLIPSAVASVILVTLTIFLSSIKSGPVMASLYSVVTSRMRATAGSITFFFLSIVGFGLGPLCVGVLSDLLTPKLGAESLRYALFAPACLFPVVAIVLHFATKTLLGDLKAVKALE